MKNFLSTFFAILFAGAIILSAHRAIELSDRRESKRQHEDLLSLEDASTAIGALGEYLEKQSKQTNDKMSFVDGKLVVENGPAMPLKISANKTFSEFVGYVELLPATIARGTSDDRAANGHQQAIIKELVRIEGLVREGGDTEKALADRIAKCVSELSAAKPPR